MRTQTSVNETSQLRMLEVIGKVALLLLYVLAFCGVTLFVFGRVHVMLGLATAVASIVGGCALTGLLFGTSKGVHLFAARMMAYTTLPALAIFLFSVTFPANEKNGVHMNAEKMKKMKSSVPGEFGG